MRFQFHKGTIRTDQSFLAGWRRNEFQFHKGTIRTVSLRLLLMVLSYFNSIKVQLELSKRELRHSVILISIP